MNKAHRTRSHGGTVAPPLTPLIDIAFL